MLHMHDGTSLFPGRIAVCHDAYACRSDLRRRQNELFTGLRGPNNVLLLSVALYDKTVGRLAGQHVEHLAVADCMLHMHDGTRLSPAGTAVCHDAYACRWP